MPLQGELARGREAFEAGRFDEAHRIAEALLARSPRDADALVLAGRVATAGIYLGSGLDCFERAVLSRPRYYLPYVELSRTYVRAGAYAVARSILELALARVEESAEGLAALASVFAEFEGREAVPLYRRALALDPQLREAEFGLVSTFVRLGDLEEARRVAGAHASADAHSLNLRAMIADAEGNEEAVRDILEQGGREHPDERSFLYNLYATKVRRALWDAAERDLDQLLARFPLDANAQFAKAAFLLRRGQFADGFAAFEARLRLPDFPAPRHAPVPRWDGGSLEGKRILVLDEQGLGDSLMFVRFLPRLLERGAAVRYVCRQPLYSLYGGQPAFTPIEVLPHGATQATHQGCDCYATLLSLPHLLGVKDPGRAPYLVPPRELVAEWAERLPGDGRPRVGVVWSANPNAPVGPERSMPLQALRPVLEMEHVRFFSLQLGGSEMLKDAPTLTDLAPEIRDFADTAGIVANLDLLLTVDTAAAHVAGVIGKPALVMVPLDTDWRWGADPNGGAYWYASARLFRQASVGDWTPVVAAVMEALKKERRP